MKNEKIILAITSALSLLQNEVDAIEFDELQSEYLQVIQNLKTALIELTKDE